MVTYVVRNQADALRVLRALDEIAPHASDTPSVRFDGWPCVTVTVPEGIGAKSGRTLLALEKIVRTQFCLAKYGTPDLRKLTARDKASIELGVQFSGAQMAIDFSKAATALIRVVNARAAAADGGRALYQQGTLGLPDNDAGHAKNPPISHVGHPKENWPTAAIRVGLAAVDKMSPAQVARAAMRAIIVAGFVIAVPVMWGHALDYNLRKQVHNDEHQLKLAELERTIIIAKSGQTIAPPAHSAVEQALAAESREIRSFVGEEYEGPFSRFVKLADRARPAILDLAQASTITINELTINAETARVGSKEMKKDPDYGWKTILKVNEQDDPWKAILRHERA